MMETSFSRAAPGRGRWLRRAGWALAGFALALGLTLALALETSPRVARAPDTASAREALAAGQALRSFLAAGATADSLTLSAREIDAVMAAGSRLAPGVAGAARPRRDGMGLDLSVGRPHLPFGLWANLSADLAATPQGLRLAHVRIGRLPLPAGLAEAAAVRAADRLLGADVTRASLAGIVGIETEAGAVTARLRYAPAERQALIDRIRAGLGAAERDKGPIHAALWWFDKGGDTGALPRSGSAVPYLRWGIERVSHMAARFPQASDRDLATAAFLALALYCGEPALGGAIGVELREKMRGAANHCAGTRLGGRADLRKHFTVSAGLHALSSGDAAFGVGELKELADSGVGGSGFSFDDMAANLSGARYAAAFLEAPRSEWPAMLARIEGEADILPDLAGLPSGLTEAEFAERFGAVDSPAYRDMIAEIEARVAALPLEAAARPAR